MKVKEFIETLSQLDPELDICIAYSEEGGMGDIVIHNVTESCDDPTIIAYVMEPA